MTANPAHAEAGGAGDGLLSRAFVALCLICFLHSFLIAPFSALFAVYVETQLQRLPWFTGSLNGLLLLLGGAFAVVGGRMCDLLGRKTTLVVGLCGAVLTGLVFRTGNTLLLGLLVVGIGAGTGPWSTAGQSFLIHAVHGRRLGLGGALFFLTNTAGGALGSLVTGLAKERCGYAQIGAAMAVGLGSAVLLAVLLLPGGDSARAPRPASATPGRQRLALWSAYRPLFGRREIQLLVGLRFLITSFWGMATLIMPLLVFRASAGSGIVAAESMPAYYASVSLSVAAACQLLTGVLADRYGRRTPLLVAAGGFAASAGALALSWGSLPSLFIGGTALTGTAWAVSTLIPKLINEMAGPDEKSRLVGLGHLVWSVAMFCGSIVGGVLVEVTPSLPFGIGAGLAAGGTACAWRLCRRLDGGRR